MYNTLHYIDERIQIVTRPICIEGVTSKMSQYTPSQKEQAFIDGVESPKHERQLITGLNPFFKENAPEDVRDFYTKDEITALLALKGTERDVEARMPVKLTRHYLEMAKRSPQLQRIVKPMIPIGYEV